MGTQETKKDTLLRKLITELQRYQSKEFLKAAMAVCALTAIADGEVSLSERYSIDRAIANEPALRPFDTATAVRILDDYIFAIREEAEVAKGVLYDKVRRIAGDPKQARTLMRVAYLIIVADQQILEAEKEEFVRLCGLLNLEPDHIWGELSG